MELYIINSFSPVKVLLTATVRSKNFNMTVVVYR